MTSFTRTTSADLPLTAAMYCMINLAVSVYQYKLAWAERKGERRKGRRRGKKRGREGGREHGSEAGKKTDDVRKKEVYLSCTRLTNEKN